MIKKLNYFLRSIFELPRYLKQLIIIIIDVSLCIISLWIAFYLRLDVLVSLNGNILLSSLISIIILIPLFWLFGLYKSIFRFSSETVIFKIALVIFIYAVIYFSIIGLYTIQNVPRSIGIIQPLILFFTLSGSRILIGIIVLSIYKLQKNIPKVENTLIYGAGSAGRQLVSALSGNLEFKVKGFIDDNPLLQGRILEGKKIFDPKNLEQIIKTKKISYIFLAIPSAKKIKKTQILKEVSKHKLNVKTIPSITDLAKGNVTISDIRSLDVEDLLGRDTIVPFNDLMIKNIESKVVLITGAGGSIGSELSRQIINFKPKQLILLDNNEYALYKILSEIEEIIVKDNIPREVSLIPSLASVQDKSRIREVMRIYKPDTVYHAAAFKHVPLVERAICEGLLNNVFGTLAIAKVSILESVSDFVLISSDKAVRPTNVMGASKRIAEICLRSLFYSKKNKKTKLCIVRFGNVLDSSGSVIPKFRKQIKNGGPVTLTHPEVTRFFMTITEAAQLVVQAGAMNKGSDVFVLDMGEPIKIKELIKKMILLSGSTLKDEKNIDGEIEIKVIGLRPGEKLYEELLIGDNPQKTKHPKIMKAQDPYVKWDELEQDLKKLQHLINENNIEEIIFLLQKLVKNYEAEKEIVDDIFLKKINEN